MVDCRTAWASGAQGTVLRTTDGGVTWQRRAVPGGEASTFAMSMPSTIGPPASCRSAPGNSRGSNGPPTPERTGIFPTGAKIRGFLDAIAFWDREHGLAKGDPIDGRYLILTTIDGGKTW